MAESNKFGSFWPSIVDTATAENVAKQGLWASIWCAGVTIICVVLTQFGVLNLGLGISALFDAFLFIIIGRGIYKMNRFAAVSGLALYVFERISLWSEYGLKSPIVVILMTLMFINSVRGIFAYHKMNKAQSKESG